MLPVVGDSTICSCWNGRDKLLICGLLLAVKTLVVKGRAPVDPECPAADSMHVYVERSVVYDVMLNQVCSQ